MVTTPSRRLLLTQAAWLAGAALTPAVWTRAVAQTRLADYPFALGVASGEPTPDGMVLWTRLAPKPLDPDGGMPRAPVAVTWEVGEDQGLKRIVARGRVRTASSNLPCAKSVAARSRSPSVRRRRVIRSSSRRACSKGQLLASRAWAESLFNSG